MQIKNLADSYNNVHLLDLYMLQKHHHTNHGFHKGKRYICNLICHILDISPVEDHADNTKQKTHCLKVTDSIKVVKANIGDMFEKYSNLGDLAFSHCISADFENDRNMSAGVTVKFRNVFGRPCYGDYCKKHLTFQKAAKCASVYSSVTKPQYCNKTSVFQ